jgi:ubiquinone/menaquinone biosynthesis C-methylase UbiE
LDYERIYAEEAGRYDRLVSAEDCEGRLRPALESICTLRGARVAEIGVGTGRLTRLLVAAGATAIRGVDVSAEMLAVARGHLEREAPAGGGCDWELAVAPASRLPLADASVDLSLAGWVFGHLTQWFRADWRARLAVALAELDRVTRPDGTQVIIETLGTGREVPAPPSAELAEYYDALEDAYGFERTWVRTDYRFHSHEEALELCGMFFGPERAAAMLGDQARRVPECTGIWWRRRRA